MRERYTLALYSFACFLSRSLETFSPSFLSFDVVCLVFSPSSSTIIIFHHLFDTMCHLFFHLFPEQRIDKFATIFLMFLLLKIIMIDQEYISTQDTIVRLTNVRELVTTVMSTSGNTIIPSIHINL
jgi:hypothetical protein